MRTESCRSDFVIDYAKSSRVACILVSDFEGKKGIFLDQKELVENQLPRDVYPLSKEHAIFLMHIISLDYATRSIRLYENGKTLFSKHPELFNPADVINIGIEKLRELITQNVGARFPNEATLRWFENSKKLLTEYNGDPRNVFIDCKDGQEALDRIRKFRGMGRKTGALLLRAFANLGFVTLSNLDRVLVPVDVHDTRIAFFTRCIQGSQKPEFYVENYPRYVRYVSEFWSKTARNANLNWLVLDRALWLLGSKGCAKGLHGSCPLRDFCIKGQPRVLGINLTQYIQEKDCR